jgi:hypothetical protein
VLPGTGGLTDGRQAAGAATTPHHTAEGVRGKRARGRRLVDN